MELDGFLAEWHDDSPTLLVHTSGSTGKPKPLWVEKRRMEASARMTCHFLGLQRGDTALLCMPLDYIAGKMMVVRSLVAGLRLLSVHPDGHPMAQVGDAPIDFAAMVPMQVYNTLQVPAERERLRHVRHLLIGGGAISGMLASALADFPHDVWSSYGMTETLSHIALRRVQDSEWYVPMPGVQVGLTDEGCLTIDAPALCAQPLTTNDRAEVDANQRFRILGRKDNVICSGGVKIQIEEVERRLQPHLPWPFVVTKRADEKFGEVVVLLVETGDTAQAMAVCARVLPKYWQPRVVCSVDAIPLTATGKPARAEAYQLAKLHPREGRTT